MQLGRQQRGDEDAEFGRGWRDMMRDKGGSAEGGGAAVNHLRFGLNGGSLAAGPADSQTAINLTGCGWRHPGGGGWKARPNTSSFGSCVIGGGRRPNTWSRR